jgi:arylsulfatase A-like enzyme
VNRRGFLGTIGAAAFSPALAQEAERPPNIVFILADDLGYGDLGCFGQKRLRTPNVDRLAAEGMRFTDAYAGSTVCAPSRCCLMTGLDTGHGRIRGNGSPTVGRVSLHSEDVTVAEILQQAGYRTGMFGKWGLGEAGSDGIPNKKGFDEWYGYLNQGHAHDYYPEHLWENESEVFLRGNLGGHRLDYSHDLIVERALEFLDKPVDRPFFLFLPITIPHANNEAGRATGDGMEVPDYGEFPTEDWPNPEKGFAAMVTRMDRDVGRVMAKLKERGVDGNTIVIFSSDNGPHREGGHDPDFFHSRGPLRGIKRDLYEGGIRVPTIARWPGKIAAGSVSAHPWAFWDFLPTAAELAGARAPQGLNGTSIVPTLMGKKQEHPGHLYWEFHERGFTQGVRMGDWKAVRARPDAPVELHNLKSDLGEKSNVAAKQPMVVKQIEEILRSARTESYEFPIRSGS